MTKLTLEVEKVEKGTFQRGESEVAYLRAMGKGLPNGRWVTSVFFGPTAEALLKQLQAGAAPGEGPADRRPIVEAEGEFKERPRPPRAGETAPRTERYFNAQTFNVLSGPSVELEKTRRMGAVALKSAEKHLKAGDVQEAYLALERFVAETTRMPRPSVEMDPDVAVEPADDAKGPEEKAEERFEAMDRRRAGAVEAAPAQPSEASPRADVPAEGQDAPEVAADAEPQAPVGEPAVADAEAAEPAMPDPASVAPSAESQAETAAEPVEGARAEPTEAGAATEADLVPEAAGEPSAPVASEAGAEDDVVFGADESQEPSASAAAPAPVADAASKEAEPAPAAAADAPAQPAGPSTVAGARPAMPARPAGRPVMPARPGVPAASPGGASTARPAVPLARPQAPAARPAAPAAGAARPSTPVSPTAAARPAGAPRPGSVPGGGPALIRPMPGRVAPRVGVMPRPAPAEPEGPEAEAPAPRP